MEQEYNKPAVRPWNPTRGSAGDVVVDDNSDYIFIYRRLRNAAIVYAVIFSPQDNFLLAQEADEDNTYGFVDNRSFHYATEEEKDILFKLMAVRGLSWNQETLQLEKI